MGVPAADDHAVALAGQGQIVAVTPFAAQQHRIFLAGNGLPDGEAGRGVDWHVHARHSSGRAECWPLAAKDKPRGNLFCLKLPADLAFVSQLQHGTDVADRFLRHRRRRVCRQPHGGRAGPARRRDHRAGRSAAGPSGSAARRRGVGRGGHRRCRHPWTTCWADRSWHAIIHFAALSLVGESMQQPMRYLRENAAGGFVLIDAAIRHQVPRFVLSSTANLFGSRTRCRSSRQRRCGRVRLTARAS